MGFKQLHSANDLYYYLSFGHTSQQKLEQDKGAEIVEVLLQE